MLMYRQVRPENADPIGEDDFPPHIKNIMKREREKEEAERKQREIDRLDQSRKDAKVFLFDDFTTHQGAEIWHA